MLVLETLRMGISADPKNCEMQVNQVMQFLKEHKNDDWYTVYSALDVLCDVALNPEIKESLRILVYFSENQRDKSHIFDFCDHHDEGNLVQRNITQRNDWKLREKASEIAARLAWRKDTPTALKEIATAKVFARKNKENEDPRVKVGIDHAHRIDDILSRVWDKQENQQEAILATILSLSEEIRQTRPVQEQKSLMEKIEAELTFIQEARLEIGRLTSLMESNTTSSNKNTKQVEEQLRFLDERSNQIKQTLQTLCHSVSLLQSNSGIASCAEETMAQQRISEISGRIEALEAEYGIKIGGNLTQRAGGDAVISGGGVGI